MISLVRAELRKYFTTRLSWGMPLATFILGAIFAAITAFFMTAGSMPTPDGSTVNMTDFYDDLSLARMVYTGGVSIGYLLTMVLGILMVGAEYRHKTLTSTLLAAPRRGHLIMAKVFALIVIVLLNGLAHIAGAVLGGGAVLLANGVAIFPEPAELSTTLLRLLLVLALWALMGLGLGVLIPNQVVALFVGVAFAFIVEPLIGVGVTFFDSVAEASRYFPSQASMSTLSLFDGVDPEAAEMMGGSGEPLQWWAAALVLLGYAAVMTLIGWILTKRRDVS